MNFLRYGQRALERHLEGEIQPEDLPDTRRVNLKAHEGKCFLAEIFNYKIVIFITLLGQFYP